MKKILASVFTITLVITVVSGATIAYFFDTETSTGNTFTAGTLDLKLDGGDENVVKFTVENMRPGNQPHRTYNLANVGSINGFLDIENIVVTPFENGCIEPEVEAGDVTCDENQGELQDVLNLRLFVDYGKDGWFSTGDREFFNGKMSTLPTSFDLNEPLNAGADFNIVALVDWHTTPNDNLAQGDSITLDMTFELGQTTAQ